MTPRRFLPAIENLGKPPTALVAGGAGFIGSYLCEKLLTLKTRVICLDNLETGKKENLKVCLGNKDFTFLEQDITKPLKDIQEKIDYIFHLAGLEEDIENQEPNIENLLTNSLGTKNLLDLALRHRSKFLLGSVLDVYFAHLSPKSLNENFSSFYSHAEAKRYSEALTTEYFKKHHIDCRIVRMADVFGPKMNLYTKKEMGKFFSSLIFDKELEVPGEGLKKIYPTYVLDLVEGLVRVIFKANTGGKVFNLIGQELSLINFAYIFRRVNPRVKIIYIKKGVELELPISHEELSKTIKEIGWQESSIEEAIKETIGYYLKEARETKETGAAVEKVPPGEVKMPPSEIKKSRFLKFPKFPKISSKGIHTLFFAPVLLLFLATLYPFLGIFWHSFFGYKKLTEIEKKKIIKNLNYTAKTAKSASNNFLSAYKEVDSLFWLATLTGKKTALQKYLKILNTTSVFSDAIYHSYLAGESLNSIFGVISNEISETPLAKIKETRLEIAESQQKLSFVSASLKELRENRMDKFFLLDKKINLFDYQKKVEEQKGFLDQIDKFLITAPVILGENQRKTYLLLLQNNMELRPAGGFIGSFTLLTFDEGKLIDFKIEDVYTADGQLKGKVNPPDEILHYLGQPNWYLRDSNFSPDFPLSAKRAQWFLEKELGVFVDGVIGIDLSLAQKLIKAFGEIEILDYKEKVTAENLFEKAEYQSEIDFFPGSTQKKNFLTALGQSLFDRLIHSKQSEYFDIVKAINEGLKEKHLMFYFADTNIQSFFSGQNLTGEIKSELTEIAPGQTNDFLMVVDANFGANKANYFLERKIRHEINIGKQYGISENVLITYKNSSPTDSWPGGKYKNYLRIYVPEKAVFGNIEMEGEKKKPKLVSALTEEELKNLQDDEFLVIEATESGRKSWGVLIEVPIKSQKSISFSYYFKEPLEFKEDIAQYSLYVQKQSGTINDPYKLSFGFPSFMKVLEKGEGKANKQTVIYDTTLLTDKEFRLKLKK